MDGVQVTVSFHMDDLLITLQSQALIDEVANLLRKDFTYMKMNAGDNHTYLGKYFG